MPKLQQKNRNHAQSSASGPHLAEVSLQIPAFLLHFTFVLQLYYKLMKAGTMPSLIFVQDPAQ